MGVVVEVQWIMSGKKLLGLASESLHDHIRLRHESLVPDL
jgi:hypothetical protein